MTTTKKRVRAQTDNIYLELNPADGKHARDIAARYGMTITAYFTALVGGETPAPMPPAFAQLGNYVSGAIAVRLLTAARAHGAQLGREWLLPTYRARIAELPEDNSEIPGRVCAYAPC